MTFTADHLDLKPTGSVLDWHIFDDGFIAGDYRIRLLGPQARYVILRAFTRGGGNGFRRRIAWKRSQLKYAR